MKIKIFLPNGNVIDIKENIRFKYYIHDDEIRKINEIAGKQVMRLDVYGTVEKLRKRLSLELYNEIDKLINEITPTLIEQLEEINKSYEEQESDIKESEQK